MQSRTPYFVFAACLGVVVALGIYRFGVMPIGWRSPVAQVFQIGAPVLLFGAWQLVKPIENRQWPIALMIPFGLLGAGLAFGGAWLIAPPLGYARLTTRDLPGFSIGFPSGDVKRETLDYSTGKLELVDVMGSGSVSSVQWEPGGGVTDADLEIYTRGIADAVDGKLEASSKDVGPGGTEVRSFTISTKKGPIFVSITHCGGRRLHVMNGGDADMETLQRRMLATLECHPDSAKEATLGVIPWTIELTSEWSRNPSDPGQIELTSGENGLYVRTMVGAVDHEGLPKVLGSLFETLGAKIVMDGWRDERLLMHGTADGQAMVGWAMPFNCPGGTVLVLPFATNGDGADALAKLVNAKGRCLRPNEPAPAWPAAH